MKSNKLRKIFYHKRDHTERIRKIYHGSKRETRILTSFLEYFPNHVMVHNILHEWQSGTWMQKVSCYPKLRLGEAYIVEALDRNKIKLLSTERINGLIGQKFN